MLKHGEAIRKVFGIEVREERRDPIALLTRRMQWEREGSLKPWVIELRIC